MIGRYHFGLWKLRPYLTHGVGGSKHGSVLDEGHAMSVSSGFGLAAQLSKHFSARAQLLRRRDGDGKNMPQFTNFWDLHHSIGTEEYDQGLSERRANAVKEYLDGKGVKASRLSACCYDQSRPVVSNDTEAGHAENRRVEMVVLDR